MAAALLTLTIILGLVVSRVNYREEITDFLPLDGEQQKAMRMFQSLSGANRIIAIVGMKDSAKSDPDRIVEATDAYVKAISGEKAKVMSTIDMEQASRLADFVYQNIPYFLTRRDYRRIDSLLNTPGYIDSQLRNDMEMLMFPSGGMLTENVGRDPLNLFTPIVEKLGGSQPLDYELYDGHIFTPDMKNAVVIIESPYGSSETEQNGKLIERLTEAKKAVSQFHDIDIRITGGPVIAVGNSNQIKTDSFITVGIALVLILALLVVSFRSLRNIALIVLTIAWGWLFALGCLSMVHSTISLIVIGISSIIIGIAVNYPLHLVAHLNHTPDMRQALREIVSPLLVGNVTTIGAFLALVPLKSVALRDLGLFAAFLLIGTIFFVFTFLPHFVKVSPVPKHDMLSRIGNVRLEDKKWLVVLVTVLTVVLGYFSLNTSFDPNVSHINYMTGEQKEDMDYLSGLLRNNPKEKTIYAVANGSTADEALANNEYLSHNLDRFAHKPGVKGIKSFAQFLPSKEEQQYRLERWNDFIARYGETIKNELIAKGEAAGFASDSFDGFFNILSGKYGTKDASFFQPLIDGAFSSNVYHDKTDGQYSVLTPITVDASKVGELSCKLDSSISKHKSNYFSFEIGRLNSSIANSLSDNFNYIGWACGLIVFFFLWVSFGNIELAALSFLPMAVSWLWILGLMSVFGIQFNIINIILATFIFGQGDDYTIFMTEGCQYEYAYGRKMLASYKNSIVISALIMFIGMGVLIFAKHPALRSLGEVTVVGMFSVVLMAYLLPPFIFKWIVSKGGRLRNRPLTLKSLLMPHRYPQVCQSGQSEDYYKQYVRDAYYYCGSEIVGKVKARLAEPTALTVSDEGENIIVKGGDYGAVALLAALMNPTKTIIMRPSDADDEAVCRNVACRIVKNIKLNHE